MKEFNDIIGYDAIKQELYRICDIINNPTKYLRLGVKVPKGILLYGEPGVGKTLFAEKFIQACGVKSYICRKNEPNGDFIKVIKNTFDLAKDNQPAIILLDDMDKYANEDKNHRDAEEYVAIQSCIDNMKKADIFVFATANDISKIPDSLVRAGRFDKVIEVKNPSGEDAKKIIDYYLSKKKFIENIDVEEISRLLNGRSCAELETVVNEAGIYAGYLNKDYISMEDIVKACLRLLYEAPETIQGGEYNSDEETAYHEAGHVVVSEMIEPKSVTLVTIGHYEGCINGFAAFYRAEEYWKSYDLMRKRLLTLLAGKASVELKFGKYDVCSVNDLNRAKALLQRMVSEYGITGFDKLNIGKYDFDNSQDLKARIENAVFNELEKCYMETKRILCENKDFIEQLVQELLKKRILRSNEIQKIKLQSTGIKN